MSERMRPYTSEMNLAHDLDATRLQLLTFREDLKARRAVLQAHARAGTFFKPMCENHAAYLAVEINYLTDELYNLLLDWQVLDSGVTP